MICKYCRYEFSVTADSRGQTLRCPNCCGAVQISNELIKCQCPACKKFLNAALWSIGTNVVCPACQETVKLTLDSASSLNLFRGPSPDVTTALTLSPGDMISKYKIEKHLGSGGMGEVYLATHTLLGTLCAIKLLRKDLALREEEKRQLLREARLTSSLHHPNIIAVYDADRDPENGNLYIVMEYVDGVSIAQILDNGNMQEERVLQIIREVAEALQSAEEMRLVHRDIKPANIMLSSRGNVKLADLGIAKTAAESTRTVAKDNRICGTPHYASPEQLKSSGTVDIRADIYSLGATMYHMLSGQEPFSAESIYNVIAMVLTKDPQPLQDLVPISSLTAELVKRMMAKDPAERPANMTELISQIDRIQHFLKTYHPSKQEQPIQLRESPRKTQPQPQILLNPEDLADSRPQESAKQLRLKAQPLKKAPAQPQVVLRKKNKLRWIAGAVSAFLLAITGVTVFFIIADGKTSSSENSQPDMTEQQPPEQRKIVLDSKWKEQLTGKSEKVDKTVLQKIPITPYTPRTPSALARPESSAAAKVDVAKYTLAARANYAKAKLAQILKQQQTKGKNYYNTQAYDFYTALDNRLQLELQARKAAPEKAVQSLCPDGRPLTDTMQALLADPESAEDKRAGYFRQLLDYARNCQHDAQFPDSTEAETIIKKLQKQRDTFDPLIHIQTLLLFVYEEENISAKTMIRLIADLQPDFSHSKFPPEALELPEDVIIALLTHTWEEVDGVSYGKSNLITEISRIEDGGRITVVNAMLEAGCNIDTPDAGGLYPLHWAIRNDQFLPAILTIAPDMQIKFKGKSILEWGMNANILYSTARRLRMAGAPLPAIPADKYPPNYRTLIHLSPSTDKKSPLCELEISASGDIVQAGYMLF